MLQGEGEAGEGGQKETLEGGSRFYPRGASSFHSMLAFHNPPTSIPSIRSWLLCNSYPTIRFPLRLLNQPNESLLKNMGSCPLEIMSGSNSFAFSISPFLHNPSIGAFDVVTCRTLIDGLCETGKIDKAEKLLLTMISGDHEPSHMIYTALIDGLCKKGEIKKAKRLL